MPDRAAPRISELQDSRALRLCVDGVSIAAQEGEMLAASLLAAGILRLRNSPRTGAPRGAFCFMGVCQECAIMVDGKLQQACQVVVRDGMMVELRGVPS